MLTLFLCREGSCTGSSHLKALYVQSSPLQTGGFIPLTLISPARGERTSKSDKYVMPF